MITDRPIEKVTVSLPESAERSKLAEIAISITDGKTPIDAVIPVQVEIIDPEGSHGEFSGFYGAAGGQLTIPDHLCAQRSHRRLGSARHRTGLAEERSRLCALAIGGGEGTLLGGRVQSTFLPDLMPFFVGTS
jgi:hypothetical protein